MHIQIEGCEASGKTTLLNRLNTYYQQLGKQVITEHFPTYTSPFGKLAREILDSKYQFKHNDFYITLLSIADQLLYSEQVNYPSDIIYLQSRGILSTIVYSDLHSVAWTHTSEKVFNLLKLLPFPDTIIYLEPEFDLVKDRLTHRSYSNIYDQVSYIQTILLRYKTVIKYLSRNSRLNIKTIPITAEQPSGYVFNTCKQYLS